MAQKDQKVLSFKVPCFFGGNKSEVEIHVGAPNPDNNPIYFQNKFLQNERGGQIPNEIIESLDQLKKLSVAHNVPLQELCAYAFKSISGGDTAINNQANASSVSELAQEVGGSGNEQINEENKIP